MPSRSEQQIFCLLLPCEAKDIFPSFGENFLVVPHVRITPPSSWRQYSPPEDTEVPFSKLDNNNKYKIGKIDKVNKTD